MAYGSRIRANPDRLFKLFAEVAAPENGAAGVILQKFPSDCEAQDVLKSIPLFCFPTGSTTSGPVQHYCFVLTDMDRMFTFGFCRLNTDGKTCLCILSELPWHDVFYKLLNFIMDLITKKPKEDLLGFLGTAYRTEIPSGGEELHIIHKLQKVEFQARCPDPNRLPTIPENRAVTEYFTALDVSTMTTIFASLLNERRIIITSKRLGRLSACVMACDILLYPMRWQHFFMPVLPKNMLDYLMAPFPFLIGVPDELMPSVLQMDVSEFVIVYADQNKVQTPFNDVEILPSSVMTCIKSASGKELGDGFARAFMRALVELIGGYRFGLRFPKGESITFDMDKFIRNRPASLQVFLDKLREPQMFQQFIDERLHFLNNGINFSDEFEQEVLHLIDHESDAKRGKGDIMKKVKDRGKLAVKELKNKMQDRSSKATLEVVSSDRFGGSEPALNISIPGSPSHPSRLSTNVSPVVQNRNSQHSGKSLNENFDSLSLQSDFLHNPGLTVDLPEKKPQKPATEAVAVVAEQDALITFDDEDKTDSVDPFLDLLDTDTEKTSNQESVKNLISLYASKSQNLPIFPANGKIPQQNLPIYPTNGKFPQQIPRSPAPSFRPAFTNSPPVWGVANQSTSFQNQSINQPINGTKQPVGANWRPGFPINQGVPRPASPNFQPRPGVSPSSNTHGLEGQPTTKKVWENFG